MATGDLTGDEACEDICVAIDAYFADRGDDKTPSGVSNEEGPSESFGILIGYW